VKGQVLVEFDNGAIASWEEYHRILKMFCFVKSAPRGNEVQDSNQLAANANANARPIGENISFDWRS
jgi:hypothetical protein